jgi:Delta7-sterol 5-desaturase
MLCEIGEAYGFVALWLTLTVLGFISMAILSTAVFIPYYVNPSFDLWKLKLNPAFPSPALVRKEIIHTSKGLVFATLCPAFSLWASQNGYAMQGYCGDVHGIGISGHLLQTALIFGFTDAIEYAYHWIGHRFKFMWKVHCHHHHFHNPSPYAVIADEPLDQFCRTLPMVLLPYLFKINMDLLFLCFAAIFYGYGVYLHFGYEVKGLSAHNPILNTSYHHYYHHARSVIGKPIYTGFFFKIWDALFNTAQKDECQCCECRPTSSRSQAAWKKTVKPDYSVLLDWSFWTNTSLNVSE